MLQFDEIGLNAEILKGIKELGFETPMPIQEKAIPVLLTAESDVIGLAETGTGKTAAFGLPILQLIDVENNTPQAVILSPTRELCIQIAKDLKNYSKHIQGLSVLSVYGGADIYRQISVLNKGVHVIVATPGRMNDLLNRRKKVDFSNIKYVVLDEADEMLNMGFKEELDAILEQTPEDKNTWLFSATMPKEVLEISKNYMTEPVELSVGKRNIGAKNVEHICYTCHARDRYLALKRIVDFNPQIYGIVFCKTRMETKDIANKLIQDGYNAEALHGDLSQAQREYIMHKFRIKNLQILVATDVAARGLDVKDLTHVINYNLPDEFAIYTHRSGRTGRAGKKGISIAIINLKEKYKIKRIENIIQKKFEFKPVPTGKDICAKQLLDLIDRLQNIEIDHEEIDPFLPEIYEKLEFLDREELIKHFVSLEFNRFLDYYKDAKDLNEPKDRVRERRDNRDKRRKSDKRDEQVEKGYARFKINLGYKDGISPRDLIGLINRRTRKRDIRIGKIILSKTDSYFEIEEKFTGSILAVFKNVEYNEKQISVSLFKEKTRNNRYYSDKQRNDRSRNEKSQGRRRKDTESRNYKDKTKKRKVKDSE